MAVDAHYLDQIKQFEGFTPTAKWDYAQHSNGYGTRARFPGETIDQAEAQRRLDLEIAQAADIVDKAAPGLDPGTRAALIDLTYNAGPKWVGSGLGEAIRAGDTGRARELFLQYNKAGGAELPGLTRRRTAGAQWFGQNGPPIAQSESPAAISEAPATHVAAASNGAPAAPQEPSGVSGLLSGLGIAGIDAPATAKKPDAATAYQRPWQDDGESILPPVAELPRLNMRQARAALGRRA